MSATMPSSPPRPPHHVRLRGCTAPSEVPEESGLDCEAETARVVVTETGYEDRCARGPGC